MSRAFENIKEKWMLASIIQGPKWNVPFYIHIFVVDKETGVVLGKKKFKEPYVIYYINKIFKEHN